MSKLLSKVSTLISKGLLLGMSVTPVPSLPLSIFMKPWSQVQPIVREVQAVPGWAPWGRGLLTGTGGVLLPYYCSMALSFQGS